MSDQLTCDAIHRQRDREVDEGPGHKIGDTRTDALRASGVHDDFEVVIVLEEMALGGLEHSPKPGQCVWLDIRRASNKSTGAAVAPKVSFEGPITAKDQSGHGVTGGYGSQEAEMKESRGGRRPSSASGQEIMRIGGGLGRRHAWRVLVHKGIGNEDDATELGKSDEEAYERHRQHVGTEQKVRNRESDRKRGPSMGRRWQRCPAVGHPASKPGEERDYPLEE